MKNLETTSNPASSYFGFSNLNPLFNDTFIFLSDAFSFDISYLLVLIIFCSLYTRFFISLNKLMNINENYFLISMPIFFIFNKLNYADIYLINGELTPNDFAWAIFFNFIIEFYKKDILKSGFLFVCMFLINPTIFIFAIPISFIFYKRFQINEIFKFSIISLILGMEQIIYIIYQRINIDPIIYALNIKASEYYFFIDKPYHYSPFPNQNNAELWPDIYIKIIIITILVIGLNGFIQHKNYFEKYLLKIINLQLILQYSFLILSYLGITNTHLLVFPFKGVIIVNFLIFILLLKNFVTSNNTFKLFSIIFISFLYFGIEYFPSTIYPVNYFLILVLLLVMYVDIKKYLVYCSLFVLALSAFINYEKIVEKNVLYSATYKTFEHIKQSDADIVLTPNRNTNLFWATEFETGKPSYFNKKFIPHDFQYLPEWNIRYEYIGRFYSGECELISESNLVFISLKKEHPCGELVYEDKDLFIFQIFELP